MLPDAPCHLLVDDYEAVLPRWWMAVQTSLLLLLLLLLCHHAAIFPKSSLVPLGLVANIGKAEALGGHRLKRARPVYIPAL